VGQKVIEATILWGRAEGLPYLFVVHSLFQFHPLEFSSIMVLLLRIIFIALSVIAFSGSIKGMQKGLTLAGSPSSPELDNIYRFLSGMYLGTGIICFWMAYTMESQEALVFFMAFTVFLAGIGRVISLSKKGTSNKKFYFYAFAELVLPIAIATLQYARMK